MTDREDVAELREAVRFLADRVQLVERELARVRGTVASVGAMAVTATPDADDPVLVALIAGADRLEHLAGQADPAPSISSL